MSDVSEMSITDRLNRLERQTRPVEDERVYSDTEQRILSMDVAVRLYERNEMMRASDDGTHRLSRGESAVATAKEIRAYLFPEDGE